MTVPSVVDPALPWREQVCRADLGLLRSMTKVFVQANDGCGSGRRLRCPVR